MDREQKLTLLDEQIESANGGRPEDFNLWREKTAVVLRNVVGDANPLHTRFMTIKYSPPMWTTSTPQGVFDNVRAGGVRQGIAILEAAKLEVEVSGGAPELSGAGGVGRTIFIVHGHDDARKHEVARVLAKLTRNEPVILHEQANGGRTLIEKFEAHAAEAGYAVVIATGDDVGRAVDADEHRPRARQNVVFELGFFFGALGRGRVALLYEEDVELPSDVDGVAYLPLDGAGGWKLLLARELDDADIGVDFSALASA